MREDLPESVALHGVAFDITKPELNDFIDNNQLSFSNWISTKNSIKDLNISRWPSYIIVDNETKVVTETFDRGDAVHKILEYYKL